MTKAELIKLLEPFPDDTRIVKRFWNDTDSGESGYEVDCDVYSVVLENASYRDNKSTIVIN